MAVSEEQAVRVQVGSAVAQDVGKGVARISPKAMAQLGVQPGDVVEVVGKRRTAVIAMRALAEDEGLDLIRLDGLQRANAGVSSGDFVELHRAQVSVARKVVLAPAQRNLRLTGSGAALRRTLANRPLVVGDVISTSVYHNHRDGGEMPEEIFRRFFQLPAYGLQEIRLVVIATSPREIVQVTDSTEIELLPQYVEPDETRPTAVTYDDLGGLRLVIDQVREMIELPLKHPELFQRLGIDPPKGVLLHGPPGTGKTLLARAIAGESEARFFHIAGPEIMGSQFGESEQRLREVFQQARQEAPSIIFIDELDAIAPKRDRVGSEVERRIVAQLLTLMDGLEPRQNVMVIAATNRVDAIDEALRRPGRFDREIVVGVPDEQGRREVLEVHTRGMPLDDDVDLDALAKISYGFVGADLASLCREAAIDSLRRLLPKIDLQKREIPESLLTELRVTRADFENAMKRIQPSALREIMIQVPDVRWDDIGGLEDAKQALREGVELPLRNPEAFRRLGIRPAKGFLLYGPPGTGKTLLAKAVAREAEANFISAKSSSLLSKWYGESEQQVAKLFARARQVSPTVIFLDEIDSLVPQRGMGIGEPAVTERVVNTILSEMDGLEELRGVVVIGATNRPNLLDSALLRPGRFDELIYVSVPNTEGRLRILKIHTADMPLDDDVDLQSIAERTSGYTGADLEDLVRRAGLHVLRETPDLEKVPMKYFELALTESRPSVTPEMEQEYEEIARSLKQELPRSAHRIGFMADRY